MTVVKLTQPGDSLTMQVAGAAEVEGDYGPAVWFQGVDGTLVYVPADSATRQLERLNLGLAETVGRVLIISRSTKVGKNGHPFWNIRLDGASEQAPKPASAPVARPAPARATNAPAPVSQPHPTAPARPAATWGVLARTYAACLRIASDQLHGVKGATPADLIAATATLFIQAARLGLPDPKRPAPKPFGNPAPSRPVVPAEPRPFDDPPLPGEGYDEVPAALQDEDDDLPF